MNILPPQLEAMRSKMNEQRKSLEQVRSFNVRRLQTDIKKITKQEIDFTKKLFEKMVPIKLVWNEETTKRLRDMVPFTVELNREEEEMEPEQAEEKSAKPDEELM